MKYYKDYLVIERKNRIEITTEDNIPVLILGLDKQSAIVSKYFTGKSFAELLKDVRSKEKESSLFKSAEIKEYYDKLLHKVPFNNKTFSLEKFKDSIKIESIREEYPLVIYVYNDIFYIDRGDIKEHPITFINSFLD